MRKYDQMNSDTVLKRLKTAKNEIENRYNIQLIGIFGSFAKGKETTKSDIDILARYGKGMTLFDDSAITLFLEDRLQRKIDLVDDASIRPEFRDEIRRSIIPI